MKKKLVALFLVTLSLCTVLAASAAGKATVNLYKDQQYALSTSINDNYAVFYGSNSSSSRFNVMFISQYQSSSGNWINDARGNAAPGKTLMTVNTYSFASPVNWRLMLNSEGLKNSTATGYIY